MFPQHDSRPERQRHARPMPLRLDESHMCMISYRGAAVRTNNDTLHARRQGGPAAAGRANQGNAVLWTASMLHQALPGAAAAATSICPRRDHQRATCAASAHGRDRSRAPRSHKALTKARMRSATARGPKLSMDPIAPASAAPAGWSYFHTVHLATTGPSGHPTCPSRSPHSCRNRRDSLR